MPEDINPDPQPPAPFEPPGKPLYVDDILSGGSIGHSVQQDIEHDLSPSSQVPPGERRQGVLSLEENYEVMQEAEAGVLRRLIDNDVHEAQVLADELQSIRERRSLTFASEANLANVQTICMDESIEASKTDAEAAHEMMALGMLAHAAGMVAVVQTQVTLGIPVAARQQTLKYAQSAIDELVGNVDDTVHVALQAIMDELKAPPSEPAA